MATIKTDKGEICLEREIGDWQPIETAPKNGSCILAWCEQYHSPVTMKYYGNLGWMIDYDLGRMKYQPTHWMPLPKPPIKDILDIVEEYKTMK